MYEEERSWSGVNRTVLEIYGAKPYQFEPTYELIWFGAINGTTIFLPRILRHKLLKHPLTQQLCTTVFKGKICNIAIFKNFFLNHEAQHAKNTFENRFSIPLRFT